MPRISAFYGIVITMNWREHLPPHFHARYSGSEAEIAVSSGVALRGRLPKRALRLVHEWAELHASELEANWTRAQDRSPLVAIEPLR